MTDSQIRDNLIKMYNYDGGTHAIFDLRVRYGLRKPQIRFDLLTDEHRIFIRENGLKLKNEEMYQALKSMGYKGGRTLIRDYRRSIGLNKPKEGAFVKEGYARKVYMSYYGDIPVGKTVKFKDGNPRNFDKDNLILSTERIENRRYKDYGKNTDNAELNVARMQISALKCAINDKEQKWQKKK